MFDKFSESARRVVFYARGQASVFGTEMITPELLLLGMLRENAVDVSRLIGGEADRCERLRKQIEENIPRGKPIPGSVDMPISKELGLVFQSTQLKRSPAWMTKRFNQVIYLSQYCAKRAAPRQRCFGRMERN